MSLFRSLLNPDVRAVVESLDAEPQQWSPHYIGEKLYGLTHVSGLRVWTQNRPYGVDIRWPGYVHSWGGVTLLSTFGLNPNHWALSKAIGRWERRSPSPRLRVPTMRELLESGK